MVSRNGESAHTLSYSYICKGTLNANCQLSSNSSACQCQAALDGPYPLRLSHQKSSIKNPCQTIRTLPSLRTDAHVKMIWKLTHDVPIGLVYVPDFARESQLNEGNINIPYMDPMGYEKHMNLVISYHTLALSREVLIEHWNPSTSNIHWIKIL